MDIPYKGYTIVPNSERQPDSRWLPVAELEVSYRGVVTPKPPLRAAPREARATRGEADVAAVKMAKAWIDAREREDTAGQASAPAPSDKNRPSPASSPPKAPVAKDTATARTPQKPRAQAASADDASRVTATADKKGPTVKAELADLYRAAGLASDEDADRLTRTLVVHFLTDRLVTVALAARLAATNEGTLSRIVDLPLATRVSLASVLGLITPGAAEGIADIDRLRTSLGAHVKAEIDSPDVWDKALRRGIEAAQELLSARPPDA